MVSSRLVAAFSLALISTALPQIAGAKEAFPFLEQHCADCHDADTKKGKLDLTELALHPDDPQNFDLWVRIHDRVQDGEMPPKDKAKGKDQKRPPVAETEAFLKTLGAQLSEADRQRQAREGRAVFRRLTRVEYENALRDLLDLPNLHVSDLLPDDGVIHGFDKSGEALDISHVQLAKYLEAADKALDYAIAWSPHPPSTFQGRFYPGQEYDFKIGLAGGDCVTIKNLKHDPSCVPLLSDKNYERGLGEMEKDHTYPYRGSIGVFRNEDCAFHPRFGSFCPVYPGLYRIRMSTWSFWWSKGEIRPSPKPEMGWLKAESRLVGYFDAPSLKPTVTEYTAWMDTGDLIYFNAASLLPIRVSEHKGRTKEYEGPGIAIDWFEAEGPIVEQWPPQSHKILFGDLPLQPFDTKSDRRAPRRELPKQMHGGYPRPQIFAPNEPKVWTVVSSDEKADAHRLLEAFMKKAFRRPVAPEEVARYTAIAEARLAAKVTFEEAMRDAYKAVLCAPDFLYLIETPGKLDPYALAARLSCFLWNSAPDQTLLDLAAQGTLAQPQVLHDQIERLLHDPRSQRFVANFLDQWLKLKQIDETTPDAHLYPEFSPCLQDGMMGESRAFFRELIDKDLSVTNVVSSDFSMLNQSLAEFYGVPGIVGHETRRVSLPAGLHRGGFLTQASVLKITANGTVTTPVKRGAWVMEKIVGKPIPPPPPDVPAIDPDTRGVTTIKDQLDRHRKDAICASCHEKMDPIGFALESFDVIGGFRTRYRSLGEGSAVDKIGRGRNPVQYKDGLPVECSGTLTNGAAFKDIDELRQLLLKDPDLLTRNLAHQLLNYATGADISFSDRAEVEKIVAAVRARNNGMRALIDEVVQSPLFQTK